MSSFIVYKKAIRCFKLSGILFERGQFFPCRLHHFFRQSRELRYLESVAAIRRARFRVIKKYQAIPEFHCAHMNIVDPSHHLGEPRHLKIMGGE